MPRRVRTHANPLRRFFHLAPPTWGEIYADPSRPFALEIGSSKGEFLLAHAVARPDVNILGAEIRKPLVDSLARRIREQGLTNAHVVYGNLAGRLREFTPTGRIEAVYILFPDPWIKKKHHKRRVLSPAFLDELRPLLPAGASVHWMTDHEDLRAWTEEVVAARTDFLPAEPEPLPARSAWEEYCLATGRPFSRLRLVAR